MLRLSLMLLLAFVFGCARDKPAPPQQAGPTQSRPQIKIDSSSELDNLSANGRRALDVAKAHLEQDLSKDQEAVFSVSENPDGYSVFLDYIVGRHDDGSPAFIVGGHCMVIVSPDFKVVRVVGGA